MAPPINDRSGDRLSCESRGSYLYLLVRGGHNMTVQAIARGWNRVTIASSGGCGLGFLLQVVLALD
ncbi:MAG: hypothetical protein VKJ24_06675 [Synechococcales bacterium]|nr:hypothetical protein [Synechococcales bacterium]